MRLRRQPIEAGTGFEESFQMTKHSSKEPGRRSLQFSLRTLLVAMLVVAAYFGGRIPVLRELEEANQKTAAAENQAQDAMMRSIVAEEKMAVAETRRAIAVRQMQAMKTLLEKKSQMAKGSPD
ncbi:MAG: hypothetical protein KY475_08875 [Planctomycetes bacterium]|nr:hypothetical protein [Planctomycetota bacterium]